MPAFVMILGGFLVICVVSIALAARKRQGEVTATATTNRLLFAILLMLFAIVLKLVSNGMDGFVLAIGLLALAVGWFGLSGLAIEW